MGQMGERGDVEVDHLLHAGPVAGLEMPVIAEACVVDKEIDIELFVGEPIGQRMAAVGAGQISLKDADIELRVERTQRRGEFLQTVFAPSY